MIRLREFVEVSEDYSIYVDMDGVLTDFDKAYIDITGKHPDSFESNDDEFWKPIDKAGVAFWEQMKWKPDGKSLWKVLKKYKPSILSAPSKSPSSSIGKRKWVSREIGSVNLILIKASLKQTYATPTSILIDDMEKNITQWVAAGGIGILHKNTNDTLKRLKKYGIK